jgi:7-keto-8-aminopelargonate synthetase-like enzyme
MHTDRCGNTCRQKRCAKGSGKEVIIQEFVYRDTTNVEPEMYDFTSNNWSYWNSNEKLKEKFGSCTRKTFDSFTTKTAILGTSHIIRKVLQCEAV